jgi:hypothetical protein
MVNKNAAQWLVPALCLSVPGIKFSEGQLAGAADD